MRAILDTAVEGIITIDERGLIELMNPAAEQHLWLLSCRSDRERTSISSMPPPITRNMIAYLANYRATGHAKIIGIGREVFGRRKDGDDFPMDWPLAKSDCRIAGFSPGSCAISRNANERSCGRRFNTPRPMRSRSPTLERRAPRKS